MLRRLLVLLPFLALPVSAADEAAATGQGVPGFEPLSVVLALLLVVALILGLGWLLRRGGLAVPGAGRAGRVLASLHLGGRERAVLIDVGGEQILLGVAPGQVRLLVHFERPVVEAPPEPGEFASLLRQWLQPRRRQ